ncbi:MAG: VWA domain-containing protein [Rhodospirillaceae bacterium]|nr:VWA domain-containing protein [Rhodospirillaceae bacterium]
MNAKRPDLPQATTGAQAVDAFLRKVATLTPAAGDGRGRLVFALDATASREPTWRAASAIQEEMFLETSRLGGLDVQLVFYRGLGECKASRWLADADSLLAAMRRVECLGGRTQIGRVLAHVRGETARQRVGALVFVGDSMEEDVDHLCHIAGELGVLGVPVFLFHEGEDARAGLAFAQIAKLSGGACCRFDSSSPAQLRALLGAVAAYAAGGRAALVDYSKRAGGATLALVDQMRGR